VTKERWRALLLVLGFFTLGALGGAAAGGAWVKRQLARSMFDGDSRGHEQLFLTALTAELELSETQRQQIEAVAARYREQRRTLLREVFDSCGKPLEDLHDKMDAEVTALLDEAQAARFARLVEARRRRFRGAPSDRAE